MEKKLPNENAIGDSQENIAFAARAMARKCWIQIDEFLEWVDQLKERGAGLGDEKLAIVKKARNLLNDVSDK